MFALFVFLGGGEWVSGEDTHLYVCTHTNDGGGKDENENFIFLLFCAVSLGSKREEISAGEQEKMQNRDGSHFHHYYHFRISLLG